MSFRVTSSRKHPCLTIDKPNLYPKWPQGLKASTRAGSIAALGGAAFVKAPVLFPLPVSPWVKRQGHRNPLAQDQ